MYENLSNHKTARAREIYLRRICRDLDIRETVMKYLNFMPDPEFHAKQLTPELKRPEKNPPTRRRPDPTKQDRPELPRRQSTAREYLHDKCDEIKGDFDKETIEKQYLKNDKDEFTTVPILVEDWTLWPPPASKNTREMKWQIEFRKQAQPLLKLSALLNMPIEDSQELFAHYDIDDEFKEPLALFAGAAVLIPYNGARVHEPGTMDKVDKALKALARAGTKRGMRMKVTRAPDDKGEESAAAKKVVTEEKKYGGDTWLSKLRSGWRVASGLAG